MKKAGSTKFFVNYSLNKNIELLDVFQTHLNFVITDRNTGYVQHLGAK